MMTIAEISAAPHLPFALRPAIESNGVVSLMKMLGNLSDVQVIEENGELRLVAHPVTNG